MKFNCVTPVPSAISLIFSPWAVLPTAHLQVTQEDLQRASCYCPPDAPPEFLETVALRRRFADLLLSYSRCLFHSAAFAFQGKAYLLAAPQRSGENHPAKPLVAALPR